MYEYQSAQTGEEKVYIKYTETTKIMGKCPKFHWGTMAIQVENANYTTTFLSIIHQRYFL